MIGLKLTKGDVVKITNENQFEGKGVLPRMLYRYMSK